MNQVTRIDELTGQHIGLRVRLRSPGGGYIEGTLAKLHHRVKSPFGTEIESLVELDEFVVPTGLSRISLRVERADSATVIDE